MQIIYKTKRVCSRSIEIELDENNIIRSVRFNGGCSGNTQGVAKLAVGRPAAEVAAMLKGVQCRGGTSCPDQLARAIESYPA